MSEYPPANDPAPFSQEGSSSSGDDGPPPEIPRPWYVAVEGDRVGPLTLPQLGELVKAGKVTDLSLAWKKGMPDWLPAGQIPELAPALNADRWDPSAKASEIRKKLKLEGRRITMRPARFAAVALLVLLFIALATSIYTRWYIILPLAAAVIVAVLWDLGRLGGSNRARDFDRFSIIVIGIAAVFLLVNYIRLSSNAARAQSLTPASIQAIRSYDPDFLREIGVMP